MRKHKKLKHHSADSTIPCISCAHLEGSFLCATCWNDVSDNIMCYRVSKLAEVGQLYNYVVDEMILPMMYCGTEILRKSLGYICGPIHRSTKPFVFTMADIFITLFTTIFFCLFLPGFLLPFLFFIGVISKLYTVNWGYKWNQKASKQWKNGVDVILKSIHLQYQESINFLKAYKEKLALFRYLKATSEKQRVDNICKKDILKPHTFRSINNIPSFTNLKNRAYAVANDETDSMMNDSIHQKPLKSTRGYKNLILSPLSSQELLFFTLPRMVITSFGYIEPISLDRIGSAISQRLLDALDKDSPKRMPLHTYRHPKLFTVVKNVGGFYCWVLDEHFHINRHLFRITKYNIQRMEHIIYIHTKKTSAKAIKDPNGNKATSSLSPCLCESSKSCTCIISESEAFEFVNYCLSQPLRPDRPLWQFLLIENVEFSKFNSVESLAKDISFVRIPYNISAPTIGSFLIFRIHHSIADGIAITNMFLLDLLTTNPFQGKEDNRQISCESTTTCDSSSPHTNTTHDNLYNAAEDMENLNAAYKADFHSSDDDKVSICHEDKVCNIHHGGNPHKEGDCADSTLCINHYGYDMIYKNEESSFDDTMDDTDEVDNSSTKTVNTYNPCDTLPLANDPSAFQSVTSNAVLKGCDKLPIRFKTKSLSPVLKNEYLHKYYTKYRQHPHKGNHSASSTAYTNEYSCEKYSPINTVDEKRQSVNIESDPSPHHEKHNKTHKPPVAVCCLPSNILSRGILLFASFLQLPFFLTNLSLLERFESFFMRMRKRNNEMKTAYPIRLHFHEIEALKSRLKGKLFTHTKEREMGVLYNYVPNILKPFFYKKKTSRASDRITLNHLFVSCIVGGYNRYWLQRIPSKERLYSGSEIQQKRINFIVPANLRLTANAAKDLKNMFASVVISVPVVPNKSATERLRHVHKSLNGSLRSLLLPITMVIEWIMYNSWSDLLLTIFQRLTEKISVIFSNVIGPPSVPYLNGAQVYTMDFIVPQPGEVGIGVSAFSCAGVINLCISTDSAVISDPNTLRQCIIDEFKELWNTSIE